MLELGAARDEIEVDVISRGRSGILGIGAEPAKVRVTRIVPGGAATTAALNIVNGLLKAMGVQARATIGEPAGPDEPPVIAVQGEDAGLLIGHRGDTLRALQFITNAMLPREAGEDVRAVVDVEQYRERRQQQLRTLANRMSERAVESGRTVTLEPMSPADRRIIHMALADNKRVMTESVGLGAERRVTIKPTGPRPLGGVGERGAAPFREERQRPDVPPRRMGPPGYPASDRTGRGGPPLRRAARFDPGFRPSAPEPPPPVDEPPDRR